MNWLKEKGKVLIGWKRKEPRYIKNIFSCHVFSHLSFRSIYSLWKLLHKKSLKLKAFVKKQNPQYFLWGGGEYRLWVFTPVVIFPRSPDISYSTFYITVLLLLICSYYYINYLHHFFNIKHPHFQIIQGVPRNMTIARRLESRLLSTLTCMILETIIT